MKLYFENNKDKNKEKIKLYRVKNMDNINEKMK